jgi:hypothetical protein
MTSGGTVRMLNHRIEGLTIRLGYFAQYDCKKRLANCISIGEEKAAGPSRLSGARSQRASAHYHVRTVGPKVRPERNGCVMLAQSIAAESARLGS